MTILLKQNSLTRAHNAQAHDYINSNINILYNNLSIEIEGVWGRKNIVTSIFVVSRKRRMGIETKQAARESEKCRLPLIEPI